MGPNSIPAAPGSISDFQKFRLTAGANQQYSNPVPLPFEGRFAIVTDVGCGMRWTQAVPKTRALSCGRRSRVVLTPRRWCQVGGSNSAGDGGKKARLTGESAI